VAEFDRRAVLPWARQAEDRPNGVPQAHFLGEAHLPDEHLAPQAPVAVLADEPLPAQAPRGAVAPALRAGKDRQAGLSQVRYLGELPDERLVAQTPVADPGDAPLPARAILELQAAAECPDGSTQARLPDARPQAAARQPPLAAPEEPPLQAHRRGVNQGPPTVGARQAWALLREARQGGQLQAVAATHRADPTARASAVIPFQDQAPEPAQPGRARAAVPADRQRADPVAAPRPE
jgi:hypothetical protein